MCTVHSARAPQLSGLSPLHSFTFKYHRLRKMLDLCTRPWRNQAKRVSGCGQCISQASKAGPARRNHHRFFEHTPHSFGSKSFFSGGKRVPKREFRILNGEEERVTFITTVCVCAHLRLSGRRRRLFFPDHTHSSFAVQGERGLNERHRKQVLILRRDLRETG